MLQTLVASLDSMTTVGDEHEWVGGAAQQPPGCRVGIEAGIWEAQTQVVSDRINWLWKERNRS